MKPSLSEVSSSSMAHKGRKSLLISILLSSNEQCPHADFRKMTSLLVDGVYESRRGMSPSNHSSLPLLVSSPNSLHPARAFNRRSHAHKGYMTLLCKYGYIFATPYSFLLPLLVAEKEEIR